MSNIVEFFLKRIGKQTYLSKFLRHINKGKKKGQERQKGKKQEREGGTEEEKKDLDENTLEQHWE